MGTDFVAANLTKYNAGGSGDNVIDDGFIKTVEKVWLDTFAFTAAIATDDTIAIASIPPNKKITDVIVTFPAMVPTTCTIDVGTETTADLFIAQAPTNVPATHAAGQADVTVIRMNATAGFQYRTTSTTNTTIYLTLNDPANTAPTAGTITTVVKYT